jgi:hypothetical protein
VYKKLLCFEIKYNFQSPSGITVDVVFFVKNHLYLGGKKFLLVAKFTLKTEKIISVVIPEYFNRSSNFMITAENPRICYL